MRFFNDTCSLSMSFFDNFLPLPLGLLLNRFGLLLRFAYDTRAGVFGGSQGSKECPFYFTHFINVFFGFF